MFWTSDLIYSYALNILIKILEGFSTLESNMHAMIVASISLRGSSVMVGEHHTWR